MKVFITRQLKLDSIFKTQLQALGHEVFGESLIEFNAVHADALKGEDWLFFYSKRGIYYLLEKYSPSSLSNYKLATIGEGTAAYLAQNYELKANFIGSGDPQDTATAFLKVAKGQRVGFIRARQSKMSVQKLLESELIIHDYVVYDNKIRQNLDLPETEIVVFTSPMNAEAYDHALGFSNQSHYIAIGRTTAKQLKNLGLHDFELASEPSEAGLLKSVKKILKNTNAH